jgi:hypothetical protein
MHPHRPGAHGRWLPAAAFAALAACHADSTRAPAADHAAAPEPQLTLDASYDWHVLLIAPFGSPLREIPIRLHEVLLFRDEAPGAAGAEDAECYAPDEAAPQFAGRTPDEYLLCFKQDRLSRIQASVRLATAQAPAEFAAACAAWLQKAAPAAGAAAGNSGNCEGRDGMIRFSAHLGEEPETTLSMILDSVPDP